MKSTWTLFLHAHLPYIRHPEHEFFLEEDWLFDAITDTYLPLLEMLKRREEAPDFLFTLSVSPTLCEMLCDALLQERYRLRLNHLQSYLTRRQNALPSGAEEQSLLHFYSTRLLGLARCFDEWNGDLLGRFRQAQNLGQIEMATCPATHAILPLLGSIKALSAQIGIARDNYEKHFGRSPRGIWVSECAFSSDLTALILHAGFQYTVLDRHGITSGEHRPQYGTYRPVTTREGLILFGRDAESAEQVWSSRNGFPGDPLYREFYRDLGHDENSESLGPLLPAGQPRHSIGLKMHRITGRDVPLERKEPYLPEPAIDRARIHARNFFDMTVSRLSEAKGHMTVPPHLLSPYDAELFGHWWFEGPVFLDALFDIILTQKDSPVVLTSPLDSIVGSQTLETVEAGLSSWGYKGFFEVWLNGTNDWIYPLLHQAEESFTNLLSRRDDFSDLESRALRQAARELLLAQSSDWAFIMTAGTFVEYAVKRTKDHLERFRSLTEMIRRGEISLHTLTAVETQDPLFPELNLQHFR